jgi:hypothetical protein
MQIVFLPKVGRNDDPALFGDDDGHGDLLLLYDQEKMYNRGVTRGKSIVADTEASLLPAVPDGRASW